MTARLDRTIAAPPVRLIRLPVPFIAARVNSISPGWIDTTGAQFEGADMTQHPVGRVGTPADIVHAVMFLCDPKSGFITGQNLVVDGGMTKQMIYHNDFGWTYRADVSG